MSFSLSEPATVTLSFARKRSRQRYATVKNRVRLKGRRGTNRVVFHGRLSKRRSLRRRGTYRLTVSTRDAGGAKARSRHARFRLVGR